MRVKRYIVDSMPDALEKIRKELGKDAIILNTKQIKTGGFLGMFRKQQIEVIAAIDNKPVVQSENSYRGTEMKRPQSNPVAAKKAYQQSTTETSLGNSNLPTAVATSPPRGAETFDKEDTAVETQIFTTGSSQETENIRKESDLLHSPVEIKEIANELKDMRDMFRKLLLVKQTNENLPTAFIALRDRLISQEIEEEIVSQILKEILCQVDDPHRLEEKEIYQQTNNIVFKMIEKGTKVSPRISRSVKYAFFFGPTGVGKTTTIAKLAAEYMLKEKRRVGFITSDTYRIAAVEQLRTYANILNVPMEVVFSPKEVEQAMERLHSCDLVLIDTAGRNYRNDEYVRSMKEFLHFGEKCENYLVLSLAAKYDDMKVILQNFKDVPISKVIFTKTDETEAYGSILNVVHQMGLSLSYMTTGQNVPDDITVATPDLVTKLIIGDDTYA